MSACERTVALGATRPGNEGSLNPIELPHTGTWRPCLSTTNRRRSLPASGRRATERECDDVPSRRVLVVRARVRTRGPPGGLEYRASSGLPEAVRIRHPGRPLRSRLAAVAAGSPTCPLALVQSTLASRRSSSAPAECCSAPECQQSLGQRTLQTPPPDLLLRVAHLTGTRSPPCIRPRRPSWLLPTRGGLWRGTDLRRHSVPSGATR